jgi:hypothetical protein
LIFGCAFGVFQVAGNTFGALITLLTTRVSQSSDAAAFEQQATNNFLQGLNPYKEANSSRRASNTIWNGRKRGRINLTKSRVCHQEPVPFLEYANIPVKLGAAADRSHLA